MRKITSALSFLALIISLTACNGNSTVDAVPANDSAISLIPEDKNPYTSLDMSPMDMAYYPTDFPIKKMNREIGEPLTARVIYSRPHTGGRAIFGSDETSLVQYGQEWRLGANEATELDIYRTVNINNANVEPGRYILYCIPEKNSWTIVLNSNANTWGLHMDSSKDILRMIVPVMQQEPTVEDFTVVFEKTVSGANLLFVWAGVKVALPMTFAAMP